VGNLDRFFQIEKEWCVLHIPEQPNGFAIIIVGDKNHYVTESTSAWLQSRERNAFIERLRQEGYTICYSNLFGSNWGSPKAVDLLKRLYHIVVREEIVNKKIHVLAEGMGGLAALKLQAEMKNCIRSLAMLSPCIDLKIQAEKEKEKRLFYKRFIKELAGAYYVEEREVEEKVIKGFDLEAHKIITPIKIWHATDRVAYSVSTHSRRLEQIQENSSFPLSLSLHLYEKRFHLGKSIVRFFENYEKEL
jgi:hypothetical protein